ncbi:MAG: NADH-quinone oxidoreductase subunit NuoF [Candidatus Thermoplasmatota archaeon]|nr:NADH-quinone oxidoreductase subunit NuoF [Candidatus Thermoplasmatota archaeon]
MTGKFTSTEELKKLIAKLSKGRSMKKGRTIIVPGGTCGKARGSDDILKAVKEGIAKGGLKEVEVRATGCIGYCSQEPMLLILPERILYPGLDPKDVPEIIEQTVKKGKVIDRLLFKDPETGKGVSILEELPFYKKQERTITGNTEKVNPESIEDYFSVGGYKGFLKALELTPDDVIMEIKTSGLRGRGGAGFSTGMKWQFARKAKGEPKYIICNADEGDPGAFMDRNLLEGNPHSVLEGLLIGAYAIGASRGFIYVRKEYPLAVKLLRKALDQMHEHGLLGENILGSEMDFDLKIYEGAGAFVCGEETALMASIEGRSGEPRPRPPFPAQSGLWGKPTNINNVKSWANVTLIMNIGAEKYSKVGTKTSTGTMLFSLVGKSINTGLVEVPMGITLREMVFDIGGGIADGNNFKAVQTGGPSGGCIPESLIDLKIDYDSLTKAGAMMGSGGMIVMDDRTCMVNIAKYFVEFLMDESCGKCAPCREGLMQTYLILKRITEGKGKMKDLDTMQQLAEVMKDTSLCALGQTAPNPILTTIKYFREEYEAHIKEHRCPAHVCKNLTKYSIDNKKCTGCTLCARNCPVEAITGEAKKAHVIDQEKCIKCGMCEQVCNFDAVEVV